MWGERDHCEFSFLGTAIERQRISDQMLTTPYAVALTPPMCWKGTVQDIPDLSASFTDKLLYTYSHLLNH